MYICYHIVVVTCIVDLLYRNKSIKKHLLWILNESVSTFVVGTQSKWKHPQQKRYEEENKPASILLFEKLHLAIFLFMRL